MNSTEPMNSVWDEFLRRLNQYPTGVHQILPACPDDRLRTVQSDLGDLPDVLREMLARFNGAKLFADVMPLATLFGVSTIPPLSELEWGIDWYIDRFTPSWRAFSQRDGDWAIAMMNYGGLIVLDDATQIHEWDTSERRWLIEKMPLAEWLDEILKSGEQYLNE